jgi:PAS domain S-box-containing protein
MILLILDGESEFVILHDRLLALNYDKKELVSFSSLNEAINTHLQPIDLILIDLSQLNSTSIETRNAFKKKFQHTPYIVLSYSNDNTLLSMAMEDGAQDYLLPEDCKNPQLGKSIQKAILRKRAYLSELNMAREKYQPQSETTLIERANEVTTILESITDAFFTVDAQWNFIYINKEAEKLFKKQREELLHKNMWDYFSEGSNSKFYKEFHKAITGHVSVHFEEYSHATEMWLSSNAYPTGSGLTVYFTDITSEKKLQDKIAKDEQNLRAIINNTKDIIWSIDREYNIISANQAFFKRTSATSSDNYFYIKGENDVIDTESKEKWMGYYSRAFNGESFKIVEKFIIDYNIVYEDISFNPIFDNNNQIIGVSCFSRDITERRSHVLRIESQNEKLKEIAWIQSHKVRGPVASILGLVEIFSHNIPEQDENKEVLEGLKNVTKDLDDTIKSIVEKANTIEL